MNLFLRLTTRTVEVVAIAASAGSVLFLNDGAAGWVVASALLAVIAWLWRAAIAERAPWPLPTAWHYACKVALYVFAAEVVALAAEWAAPLFFAAALGSELAALHSNGLPGERPVRAEAVSRADAVSRVAGRVA